MDRERMPIRGRHPGNVDGARRRRRRGAPTWSTLAPVFPLSLSHPLTPARGIKEKDIHRGGRSSPGQTATTLARRRSFARADSRVHRRLSRTITSRREPRRSSILQEVQHARVIFIHSSPVLRNFTRKPCRLGIHRWVPSEGIRVFFLFLLLFWIADARSPARGGSVTVDFKSAKQVAMDASIGWVEILFKSIVIPQVRLAALRESACRKKKPRWSVTAKWPSLASRLKAETPVSKGRIIPNFQKNAMKREQRIDAASLWQLWFQRFGAGIKKELYPHLAIRVH